MIHVDRKNIEVPKIFFSKEMDIAKERLESFYSGKKESRSQKRFSKQFEPELRTPILQSLRVLFNGKCAYCESTVKEDRTSIYDHFRPKYGARGLEKEFGEEHYWWLTYEWNNFYYACSECNQFKATWFPVEGKRSRPRMLYEKIILEEKNLFIDPCNDVPSEHLIFQKDGKVDFLTERGKVTIDLLKLNRKRLLESRSRVLKDTYGTWEELLKLWNKKEQNWKRLQEIGIEWASIINETSNQPYLAASKQLIIERLEHYPEIQSFFTEDQYKWKIETRELTWDSEHEKISIPTRKEKLSSQDKKEIEESLQTSVISNQLYLNSIELSNFKCFDNLKLKFDRWSDDEVASEELQQWHLFLGENGVGKSSILKAIAIALMDSSYRSKMKDYLSPNNLLKHEKRSGYIKLNYNDGEEIKVNFSKNGGELTSSTDIPLTNIIGYGSVRLLPKKRIQPEKGVFKGVKVENLFDYTVSLADANAWLLKRSKKDFDRAAKTLKDLMLLDEDVILVRDKENQSVLVTEKPKKSVRIDDLSDGYKTVYALAVDIMSTLSSENITYNLAEGIILIDEIGTHLHPRWKMQVVERLRAAFPKLQFVVSTHEPLCLRGLRAKETIVLAINEDQEVFAITDLPDPSELRIDQILTSDFFGLKSTFDPQTEAIFEEYYAILAKDDNDRSPLEKARVIELSEIIPRIKHLGDNLREELVYYVVDELLAKKVKEDGLTISEGLKEEAIKRVETMWKSIK